MLASGHNAPAETDLLTYFKQLEKNTQNLGDNNFNIGQRKAQDGDPLREGKWMR